MKERTYGVSLSGGGARAIVQLGILQRLYEHGIKPSVIAGTSMGALIATFIAAGYEPKSICTIFKKHIDTLSFSWLSLVYARHRSMVALMNVLRDNLRENSFSKLDIPLYVSVTNLNTGKNEIISSGKLFEYVIASATIPVLFKPKVIDGKHYVDGGVTNNFPARVLQGKADKIIGIHVNYIEPVDSFTSIIDIADRIYQVSIYNTVQHKIHLCDYFIDPPESRKYLTFDFPKIDEIYAVGYDLGEDFAQKIIHTSSSVDT
ncbi:MAG: patatin-like phospholipase family protein [Bacteroidales bacterium]